MVSIDISRVGTNVVGAKSRERFIINAKSAKHTNEVEVVYRLEPVDLLVVRGSEKDVKKLGGKYALELVYTPDLPVKPTQESMTDEPYQWDLEIHPTLAGPLNTDLGCYEGSSAHIKQGTNNRCWAWPRSNDRSSLTLRRERQSWLR
jgi:hypothetical protein